MFDHRSTPLAFVLRHCLAVVLACVLCACGAPDNPPGEPLLQQPLTGDIDSTPTVVSRQSGYSYRLNVYLPPNYAGTSDKLPVIYVLDGGPDNGLFRPLAQITEGLGLRAIIVGIGGYARRETDYRYPGLDSYYTFLTRELLPQMEAQYRIAPEQRTLVGHSFGGYFAASAMLLDRSSGHTFSNFIVMDMATKEQGGPLADLERAMYTATGGKLPDTRLVLSGDSFGNADAVDSFHRLMAARGYQGLEMTQLGTTSYGHVEMINTAYKESLRRIFKL